MAKRRKKKGRRQTSVSPPPASAGQQPVMPISPREATPTRGRIRRAAAHVLSSARDYALQTFFEFLKPIVVAVVLAVLGAIFLYWQTGRAAWFSPWFTHVAAFIGGFLTLAIIIVGLALLGVHRRRTKERQRINKYASTVKGPIDYLAELGPTISKMQSVFAEIGKETIGLSEQIGKLVEAVAQPHPILRQRGASKGAAALNKRCLRIEIAAERLIEVTDAALEAVQGVLEHEPSASKGNRQRLTEVQKAVIVMYNAAEKVITTQEKMRQLAQEAYGTASMDIHTSLNLIMATNKQIIGVMEPFKTRLELNIVPLLEGKLSS